MPKAVRVSAAIESPLASASMVVARATPSGGRQSRVTFDFNVSRVDVADEGWLDRRASLPRTTATVNWSAGPPR